MAGRKGGKFMNIKLNLEPVLRCLPKAIGEAAAKHEVEEIRLLAGQPVMLYIGGEGFFISSMGDITPAQGNGISISKGQLGEVFLSLIHIFSYLILSVKSGFYGVASKASVAALT